MLSFTAVIVLILLAVSVWIWNINLQAREVAVTSVKEACATRGLQLLDATIHFHKCKLKRNLNDKLGIMRLYRFEYFYGNLRHQGHATVLALAVESIEFEHMEQPTNTEKTENNVIQFPNKKNNPQDHS